MVGHSDLTLRTPVGRVFIAGGGRGCKGKLRLGGFPLFQWLRVGVAL
jgi:hypothetical protein